MSPASALETLSYSGRLVQANGAPVTGTPDIKIELAYTGTTSGTVRCSQNFTSVPLTNGVFHLKLNLNCGAYGTLTDVLSVVPAGESAAIRVTDVTIPAQPKVYSYQAIHSMPFANVAAQLVQMNATDGQVLRWNEGQKKWKAETLTAGGGGTVTTVSGTLPISVANGSVTPVISISQADTSTSGYLSSADWNAFNSKQGALPAGGTSAHYYRGDNSWQTLDTSVVPENTNLYFTNARALGVPLSGFTTATGAIVDTDTAIQAFGKAQGQINSLVTDSSKYLIKNNTDSITGLVNVGTTGLLQLIYTPVGLNDATNKAYVDSEVGTRVNKTGDTISGVLTLDNDLKIKGGSNHVTVKGHATSNNYNLVLPQTAGTAGYVLSTDGSGNTSWVTPAVGSSSITDGSIVDADVNASAAIAQSKILNLTTDLAGKQPLISAGTNAQYFRGDKTFVDLGTDVRNTALTGFAIGANSAIVATDSTLDAFKKVQGQIDATNTAVAGKEASLTAGSTSQYYRGDKSWQTLNGGVVANTAAGNIAATNVQSALNELDTEKQDKLTSASMVDSRELRFYELPGNGTFYSSLKSPDDLIANINYVLPVVAPTAGQVLSSSAAGVMSWITIPSAPVTTVHGRTGAVVSANGDYTASQITNVPAGTIAATTVQAALNELDSNKQASITAGTTAQYYRGDKTWAPFATDAINSVLSTFAVGAGSKPAVTNTDTVVGAFGKVQKTLNDINADYVSKTADQTINGTLAINSVTGFITVPTPVNPNDAVNKSYVDGFGHWAKNGSDINFGGGNVGIGITTPAQKLSVAGMVESTVGGFKFPDGSTQSTAYTGSAGSVGSAVAWVVYNSAGTILSSFNVASVTKASTGKFTVNFQNTLSDANYAVVTGGANTGVGDGSWASVDNNVASPKTTSAVKIVSYNNTGSVQDYPETSVVIFQGNGTAPIANGQWTQAGANVYRSSGNVGIGTTTPAQKLTVGVQSGQSNANISARAGNSNSFEWGHSNTSGYASTLGFSMGSGQPFLCFNCEAGTTNNTFMTRGLKGATLTSDNAGGFLFATIPTASADNQTATNLMSVTSAGNVGIGTITPAAKLDVAGEVKFGNTASTCNGTTEGQQRYNSTSKKMEFCNGTAWTEYGNPTVNYERQVSSSATGTPITLTCSAGYKVTGCVCSYTDTATQFFAGYCRILSDTQCWGKSFYGAPYNYEVTMTCIK